MSDRSEELTGNLKARLGRLTANQRLEAEGQAESKAAVARRELKRAPARGWRGAGRRPQAARR